LRIANSKLSIRQLSAFQCDLGTSLRSGFIKTSFNPNRNMKRLFSFLPKDMLDNTVSKIDMSQWMTETSDSDRRK
jgi:hypothetical protein